MLVVVSTVISICERGGAKLTGRVVVEEAVQSSTIHEDTATVHHPQSPAHIALSRNTDTAGREIRIIPAVHDREHSTRVRIRLPVRCLRLDLSCKDVFRADELVLVQGVMFDRSADHPDSAGCGGRVQTAAGVHGDLGLVRVFDIMVCGPEPGVFHVEACG